MVIASPVVLHVTTTPISLVLLLGPQLRTFRDRGYRVVTASAPGPEVEQLLDWGLEHRALRHATRSSAPLQDLLALHELHRLIRTLRPEIVHTHNPKPGVYGRLAAAAARVPAVVNTVHGLYAQPTDPWRRKAVVYALERVAAACSDAELVQNPEDLETLARLGVPRDRLTLLGNGVDLQRFRPGAVSAREARDLRTGLGFGPEDVVVCAVGRLVWEKGYRELFAAAAECRAQGSPVRWVVVGPPDRSKDDRVDEHSVREAERDGVRFLGFRQDMPPLYAASDLFVLASHREGFPRAAMEAAAMGLPVVATDVRGCRQVVDDGVTGLLVPVQDAPALAAAVHTMAASPSMRTEMSRAALAKARREFDQARVIDTTLSVYSRLLEGRARAA
jgi:glycosyltransferase involved in cell wall biosynthesis